MLWYNPQNSIIYPGIRTILWYNPQNSIIIIPRTKNHTVSAISAFSVVEVQSSLFVVAHKITHLKSSYTNV